MMNEWNSIETVPKDGTIIDLWCETHFDQYEGRRFVDCSWPKYGSTPRWESERWLNLPRTPLEWKPTHWMSRPKSPSEQPEENKLHAALEFYARPEHWMSLHETGGNRTVLVAIGSGSTVDGWAVAKDALIGMSA